MFCRTMRIGGGGKIEAIDPGSAAAGVPPVLEIRGGDYIASWRRGPEAGLAFDGRCWWWESEVVCLVTKPKVA